MSILLTIVLLLCAWLAWRLWSVRRLVGDLLRAARESRRLLLEKDSRLLRSYHLDKLVAEYNRLQGEKASITGTGQEYHSQIQTLLGNLREAVAMVDRENRVVSANPALRELAGVELDPVGRRLDTLFQGTAFLEFIQRVHKEGRGHLTEIKVRIGQANRWLEVSAAPLRGEPSRGDRYTLFIFHDITRLKGLEKMRTEFVANVSHELRTPVTIIKGFAETLVEDEAILEPEAKRTFLEKIHRNAERLNHLLQDLLLISRLESTEMVVRKERLPLKPFILETVENWTGAHSSVAFRVETDLVAEVDVEADPLRLSQVLTNLLDNAARHAHGATRVLLQTGCTEKVVHISVEDDGPGIPEKDLPHVFQRFFRVEKGRSRESGGTGLGLSIVKHIVAQHGGNVTAWSRIGEGTRITVTLPLPVAGNQESTRSAVSEA